MDYCCARSSQAGATLVPNHTGRVRLLLDYRADCSDATLVQLSSSTTTALLLPIDVATAVIDRCPLPVAEDKPIQIVIEASGGLRCCGRTTVARVAIEPTTPNDGGWSAERCKFLHEGLQAAMSIGRDAATSFVRSLPP